MPRTSLPDVMSIWPPCPTKPVHLRNPYGAESEASGDERRGLEVAGMPGAERS